MPLKHLIIQEAFLREEFLTNSPGVYPKKLVDPAKGKERSLGIEIITPSG